MLQRVPTALIMLGAMPPPSAFMYRDFIIKQVKVHGHHLWSLIYQSEVRMRRERMEYIRRDLSDSFDNMIRKDPDGEHAFNPDMPWASVFEAAVNDDKYWNSNISIPCLQVATKVRNIHHFLDDDARTAGPSTGSIGDFLKAATDPPPKRTKNNGNQNQIEQQLRQQVQQLKDSNA